MRTAKVADADVIFYSFGTSKIIDVEVPSYHYAVDVNTLRDPIGNKELTSKSRDGRDEAVVEWIKTDRRIPAILDTVQLVAETHLDAAKEPYVVVAFHDFHGKWISPALAELAATQLDNLGYKTFIINKGL